LIQKGISTLVVGLILAIITASALGLYLYWARTQTSSLLQQPLQPCPVIVMVAYNGSYSNIFIVFTGDMRSDEYVHIIVFNASSKTSLLLQATFSSISMYFDKLSIEDIAKLTSSSTGFNMIFSQAIPTEVMYTMNNLTFSTVKQTPFYGLLQQNNYYAFQSMFTVSPNTSAKYIFKLTAVGAYEIIVIDAIKGIIINRTGYYTSSTADLKQVNNPIILTAPLYKGIIYSVIVRQVILYQNVVDQQSPYLWLEISMPIALQFSTNYLPATSTTLNKLFVGYSTDVITVPGNKKGYVHKVSLNDIPLYWVCRGFIVPIQR